VSPHPYYPSGNPRFNHIALSVPAPLLEEGGRRDIVRFWSEVFGFDEMPTMTIDGKRLILSCVHWDQFIFLVAQDDPLRCPRMDTSASRSAAATSSSPRATGRWPSASTTTGST